MPISFYLYGGEKFHGKLNAISRAENYLRRGPKTLEWFPLCPFILPLPVWSRRDRSFKLLPLFFLLSLSSFYFSLQKYIYTRQLGVLCLPEFHNRHLFQFLPSSVPPPPFSFPKGMGKWKLTPFPPIVKKRMDNCLQLITKFAQRRACVTPRKNFAGGIMENTVDPKYGGGKWIEAKFKGKKKLWKDCSNKKEWCAWFLFLFLRWKNF